MLKDAGMQEGGRGGEGRIPIIGVPSDTVVSAEDVHVVPNEGKVVHKVGINT